MSSEHPAVVMDPPTRIANTLFLLLGSIAIYQIGTGVLAALVPLRLAADGQSATMIGIVSTAFSIGFVAGCLAAPLLFSRVGAVPGFALLALLNAVVTGIMLLSADPWVWAVTRVVSGLCNASLFVLVEAWLARLTTASSRGSVFGIYMALNRIMFAGGQLALVWIDPKLAILFIVSAAAYVLAPGPMAMIRAAPPTVPAKARPDLGQLMIGAPAAAIGVAYHGVVTVAGPALFPVWGLAHELSTETITIALSVMQIGGLVLQMPMAMLSDTWGRRTVMGLAAGMTALVSIALAAEYALPTVALLLLAALWGGAPAVIYAVASAHASDIAREDQRIPWASALLVIWGLGAIAGPLVASVLMDHLGAAALPGFTAAMSMAFLVFIAWRKIVRGPPVRSTPVDAVVGRMVGTTVRPDGEQHQESESEGESDRGRGGP